MNNIKKLNISVSDVLDECIKNYNPAKKSNYLDNKEKLIIASKLYEDLSINHKMEEFKSNEFAGFEKDELVKLYTYRMGNARAKNPYRTMILNNTDMHLCPYCNMNQISTLDHILPKAKYQNLAITPTNLVPSCKDCNTNKGAVVPSQELQPINLYFDDIDSFRWLLVDFTVTEESYDLSPNYCISDNLKRKDLKLYENIKFLHNQLDLFDRYYYQILGDLKILSQLYNRYSKYNFWDRMKEESELNDLNYGLNYYKSAFYFSLNENKDFITNYFNKRNVKDALHNNYSI